MSDIGGKMKRYYLAEIVGDGSMEDPYRSKVVAVLGFQIANATVFPPMIGDVFARNCCLTIIDAVDHTPLEGVGGIYALPDLPLDATLGVMAPAARTELDAALEAWGFSIKISPQAVYRDVIRGAGRELQSTFHENAFDANM